MRESAFQQKVLKFLKDKKIYAIKFNASGLTKVGVPDILMCLRGRFVGIEVKTDTGKQSELQKYNAQEIIKSGGEYILLRPKEFDEFKDLINKYE